MTPPMKRSVWPTACSSTAYPVSPTLSRSGMINLDRRRAASQTDAGVCHMGIGREAREPRGDGRQQAMSSPLLETTIEGAYSIIINFTGGHDMKIKEINEVTQV